MKPPTPSPPPPSPRDATCVIYGRLSKGDASIEAQEARTTDYAKFKQFAIAGSFTDDDTTGDTYKLPFLTRKGGRAAFRLIDSGTAGHLVVAKLDRLGRRTKDIIALVERLDAQGIRLHIVDFAGAVVDSGPFGKFVITMMSAFSELELSEIRDRTRKRLDHKRQAGEIVGTIPYGWKGYYLFGPHPQWVDVALSPAQIAEFTADCGPLSCKRLQPDRYELSWLRWMKRQRDAGASLEFIAAKLNFHGVPAKRGGKWQAGNVEGVVTGSYTRRLFANELPPDLVLPDEEPLLTVP